MVFFSNFEIMNLDESLDMNPAKASSDGTDYRVFGSKPGAYGAGLQTLIDERCWESDEDLKRVYVAWILFYQEGEIIWCKSLHIY